MNLKSRAANILMVAVALALPIKAGGCGSTACITVTPAQLVNGSCPSSQAAQARFSGPDCPGTISSVDSDGTLNGGLCCYSVTTLSGDSEVDCAGTGGTSGDGVFEEESSSVGPGGLGGGQSCGGSCQDALNGAPFGSVCPSSSTVLMALQVCACNGTCMAACDPTLCVGNAPDGGCLSCLQMSCSSQLTACHQG